MKPIKPIKPAPSIPVKVKGKQLSLQSENIKKIQKYQSDHFLEQIDKPGRIDKFTEQIPPLPCQFKQKQEKEFISLPEFIQQENPPPFGGAQAVNDLSDEKEILEQQLQLQLVKYLRITQLKKQQEKDRYSSINEAQQEDSFETLREIQIELQKEHDQYIENFVKKLENEKVEKKVNQFIRLPLPELLRITDHFDMEKKDKFRALSAQERKSVQIDHQKKQEEIKVEGKIKNIKEMEAIIEETKKDYFKIIRDLDMLNKGARQIKNFTSQKYGLRQKVEEPNIDNLLKKVKDTIWYHGGVTEGFDREMDLIKYKNSQAKNLLDINKVIEQSELEEKKQKEKEDKEKIKQQQQYEQEQEQEQKNEKLQQKMDQSYASQKTQASVKSTNKVISSKKGKELMDMMSEDLF